MITRIYITLAIFSTVVIWEAITNRIMEYDGLVESFGDCIPHDAVLGIIDESEGQVRVVVYFITFIFICNFFVFNHCFKGVIKSIVYNKPSFLRYSINLLIVLITLIVVISTNLVASVFFNNNYYLTALITTAITVFYLIYKNRITFENIIRSKRILIDIFIISIFTSFILFHITWLAILHDISKHIYPTKEFEFIDCPTTG
ncbi:MAG: hypothetical protein O2970_10225 [Proteobacteria bacterium]|nr:hypothetical protein [Pseudomonadota bacterium]MDA0967318.1 hypothetical protein [Pseudomonadota bacterium]MDG4548342.1 hypothetical protein [Rickettsiales bacterium]